MKKFVLLAATLALCAGAQAQTTGGIVEQSNEYRFQIDLAVNPASLNKLLPAGWESAAATQGPAKDCNLRLIFIDRINVLDGDSRVLPPGKDTLVYLEAPVRQSAQPKLTGRMVLAGISQNDTATAGTFGVLIKATKTATTRSIATTGDATLVTEDWDLTGSGGEHARLHVKFVRGPSSRAVADVRFFDPADPAKFVVAHTEQETDITRNVTTQPPDRIREFSFEAGGGGFAALLDGSQRPLSWDAQPTYRRAISRP